MNEHFSVPSNEEHDSIPQERRKISLPRKSAISEYLNADPIQMIWEPIRELTKQIEAQRGILSANRNIPTELRALGKTHVIGKTRQIDVEQNVHREDEWRLKEIQSMEAAAQILLEGLDSVSRGVRPSEAFFDSLDDLEESASQEVQRLFTIDSVSPTVDSRIGLRATSDRLKAIQDFRQQCLSLRPTN